MCRYGVPEPYEKLKAATRGQAVTQESLHQLIQNLAGSIPEDALQALQALTPAAYVGNAAQQAEDLAHWLSQELV